MLLHGEELAEPEGEENAGLRGDLGGIARGGGVRREDKGKRKRGGEEDGRKRGEMGEGKEKEGGE